MKSRVILIFILLLAAFLRLYHLDSLPTGLSWDEAALGYNAYSILKTGRDEHGAFMPLVFKSFGDYKPGLYVYLAVPSVALFGLNEFATRLPSALSGILAVYGIYLLTNQLFKDSKLKSIKLFGSWEVELGTFAALVLAFNPWHIHFSRGAWEVNVYLTLLLFALYFLHKAIHQKFPFWPSIILATTTFLVYQGAKLLTPLTFFATLALYYPVSFKRVINIRQHLPDKIVTTFCAAFVVALFIANLSGPAGNRLNRLSIFNYEPPAGTNFFEHGFDLFPRLISSRYLNHFSPEMLFYDSVVIEPRGHIPHQGLFYLFDALLITLGLFVLMRNWNKEALWLLLIAGITPIPASLTLAEFSTVRALFLVVPLTIIGSLGLAKILSYKLSSILVPFYLLNLVYGLDVYFNHSQEVFYNEFNAGYKPAIEAIKNNPADRVIMTDVYGQPYIYYLFHTAYDPATFQKNREFIDGGVDVGFVPRIDNLEFHQFNTEELKSSPNTIFIGTEGNLPSSYNYAQDYLVYYQDAASPDKNQLFLRIVKTK